MVQTPAPQQRGSWWTENESEMRMKMRWQLPKRDTRRGAQKKKGKMRKHQHNNTPSPERANPERAREKKKRTDQHRLEEGGRTEAPDTTYKARAKPTSAVERPKVETESRVYKVLTRGLNRAHLGHAQTQALYGIKPWVNSFYLSRTTL